MPFRWTINPYRGCEFGCKYCYARYTHEFMELHDSEAFEHKIFVKHFDGVAFQSELRRLPTGEAIAIGTATDPYQPAEGHYRLTRGSLEVLADPQRGLAGTIANARVGAKVVVDDRTGHRILARWNLRRPGRWAR